MNASPGDRHSRGSNQGGMRAFNERLVLSLLRRHGALAKADIAQMTGLSAQTVSVIMRELEKDGLLLRRKPQRVAGKVGQPSIPMTLNAGGAYAYGLKLGRRSSDIVLIDFLGNIIANYHQTYAYPTPAGILELTQKAIADIDAQLTDEQRSRVAGLGIGMPFQLWNWVETIGAPAEVMNSWRNVDICELLQASYDFPVTLQNDATAACAAELVFGQYAGPRDFAYFYLGYFIGGGLVLNASLYPGRTGNAGALGPMPVPDLHGKATQLMDVASIWVLEREIRKAGGDSSSLWQAPEGWQVESSVLDSWIDSSGHGIAHAIVSIQSVIDFEAIIIDGWLPEKVRSQLVEATRQHAGKLDFTGIDLPRIIEGKVGYNARALGAASLPLSERFMTHPGSLLTT